ncbi:zinc ribbon domain-containing protein [bacterium]|nr:zinc ribbon domain-containing protein [bacterium]
MVENAHPAIITTDEAKAILDVRKEQSKSKSFGKSHKRLRNSPYLLSGGLSKCGRCGSNLVGFKKDRNHAYYVCGSIQYRKGKGCGPGVYIPQMELEEEVINGLEEMMSKFTVSDGFEDKINNEIKRIWENETGVTSHVEKELREVEIKLKNIYDAIENGFHADTALLERSQKLQVRKDELENICRLKLNPPSIDSNAVREYVTDLRRVINSKNAVESRKLLRMSVEGIMFDPEALEVMINYKIPESVGFKMVAGGGFEPPTFGL